MRERVFHSNPTKNATNDKEWGERHFANQRKGDYAHPSCCSVCRGRIRDAEHGWQCMECGNIIMGDDFFLGRNNAIKEMELKNDK